MSLSAAEKLEVTRLVEGSELPVRCTLRELGVSRSSFYRWYRQYLDNGPEGLEPSSRSPRRFWNKLPETVKEQCLEIALQHPDKSPRELAWTITDEHSCFISGSSVYRLLKQYDLITSPAYILMQAGIRFRIQHDESTSYGRRTSPTFVSWVGGGITCPRCWMITPAISLPGS